MEQNLLLKISELIKQEPISIDVSGIIENLKSKDKETIDCVLSYLDSMNEYDLYKQLEAIYY